VKWEKKGLIWGPDGSSAWARHSALQPTAVALGEDVLRVFVGMRDDTGVGRVGFVDVDAENPARVLRVSDRPALDIGKAGTFDENGVVPCAIVRREGMLYLYYAGYQLGHKVRFVAYGGLAVSTDEGVTFRRLHDVPLTDRTDEDLYFRVIHCMLPENGIWRAWYGGGREYMPYGERTLPVYDIRYMESPDGVTFPRDGKTALTFEDAAEYRVGRPQVLYDGDRYRMFYAAATQERGFRLGYAESTDGYVWTRRDDQVGIDVTPGSWDSEMISYPNVIRHRDRFYLFYNGNDYGKQGFGYAVLQQW
jgi:predicted GH43/DUF377 family glycosyl hydrolase